MADIDLNLTDGNDHNVALYMLDWDTTSRAHTITVFDPVKGTEFYNQNFSGFNAGKWVLWRLKGRVFINLTKTAGYNAVTSGIFFDP